MNSLLKKIVIISNCLLVATSCIQTKKNADTPPAVTTAEELPKYFYLDNFGIKPYHIFIKYNQPVNGYEVTVMCFPLVADKDREHEIVGKAIMKFNSKDKPDFTIYNEFYSDSILYYVNEQEFKNEEILHLDYYPKKPDEYLSRNSPFFFSDVDFDGEEELIINNWRNGIKYCNSYQIYKIGEVSPFVEPLVYPPYNKMNDYNTEFDSANHTITGYWEDGVAEKYKIENGKSTLLLR